MNENSMSELLCAFLDGELEGAEAETLFYMLAHNQDLQTEMRRLIALNAGFRKELLAPPERLKTNIDQQLGWNASPAPSPIVAILKSRPFLMLASAVCAVLLTLQFAGTSDANSSQTSTANTVAANTTRYPIAGTGAASEPQSEKVEVYTAGTESMHLVRPNAVPTLSMYETAQSATDQQNEEQKNNRTAITPAILATEELSADDLFAPQAISTNNALLAASSPDDISAGSVEPVMNRSFALHLRGFSARSFPNLNVDPLAMPTINNIGIGLSYRIADEHRIGIEVGQENLLQRYFDTEGAVLKTIEQNYLAFWSGATHRYTPELGSALQPFVQTFVGGTRTGPMMRSMLGVEYRTGALGIAAGVEGTLHLYRYQDIWYSTRKLGISYSLSFHF